MYTFCSCPTKKLRAAVVVLFLLAVLSSPVSVLAMTDPSTGSRFASAGIRQHVDASMLTGMTPGVVSSTTGNARERSVVTAKTDGRVALLSPPYAPLLGPTDNVTIATNTTWTSGTVVLNNLVITNSATLILSGTTVITAANITVAEGAVISADGQGYGTDQGPGAGENDDHGGSGGGHGGKGGHGGYYGDGGNEYGSVFEPVALGSGGGKGRDQIYGGSGGGAIKLVVSDTLTIDGELSADGDAGENTTTNSWGGGGGGSGGSIWIEAATIIGDGLITADGGDGGSGTKSDTGGGGGGRVAVYYTSSFFDLNNNIQAYGGIPHLSTDYGGAGTIYLESSSGSDALRVDNGGHNGQRAGLIAGAYQFDTIALTGYGHLTVISDTSVLTLTNDTLVGDGTARLVGEGEIVAPAHFTVTTATLVIQGNLVGSEYITTTNSGGLELAAHTPWHTGVYTFTELTVGTDTTLTLLSHVVVTGVYTGDYSVELRLTNLTVANGGTISADDQGYEYIGEPGTGGPGVGGSSNYGGGGGGHGGKGGNGFDISGGDEYGSVFEPVALGSGGGKGREEVYGGSGGGAVKLVVSDTLTIDGEISADGETGEATTTSSWGGGGGGSGGSIWIEAATITGVGSVTADGGDGGYAENSLRISGGGGGGRVAVYYTTSSFDLNNNIQASGGSPSPITSTSTYYGGAGTIYLGAVDPLTSTLVAVPADGLVADGAETATITVTLLNTDGYPVPGKQVSLEIAQGTDDIVNGVPITDYVPVLIGTSDVSGTVTATLASTEAEVKEVFAWAENVRLVHPVTVTFVAGSPDAAESLVWPDPSDPVAADGVTTATIRVLLYDAYHNPVPEAAVTLSATASVSDTAVTLTQPTAPTGANGQTWGAIRSAVPQVVTVTATISGVLVTDAAQVTFEGADLRATKSGPGTALAGTLVTYTLTVENEGELMANGVVLTDTLPQGTTFVTHTASYTFTQVGQTLTWHIDSLAKQAQANFELVAMVAPTVAHHAQLTNYVTATTISVEENTANNTATVATTVYQPELELKVTPPYSELTLQQGTKATVTLQLKNTGTASAGGLTVSPPQHLDWTSTTPASISNLGPGQSATITATMAVPADLQEGIYRDVMTVQQDGVTYAGAAFSVNVVDVTRTLDISVTSVVTETPVPVNDASVYLVRRADSILSTEGVTKTIHAESYAWTNVDGEAVAQVLLGTYDYTVVADGYGAAQGVVTVTALTTDPLTVTLEGLPLLVPEPLHPEIYVRPGETGLFEALVRNVGLDAATNVQITPLNAPDWIYVGVIGSTDELTAGQALSVTLFASPPPTTTPAIYRQTVAVTSGSAPDTHFALTVRVGTQETATLQLRITDPAGTPLEGARVTLVNKESTLVHTEGVTRTYYDNFVGKTSAGGIVIFEGIPAGRYSYYAAASGYEPIAVDPVCTGGETCTEDVVLQPLPFDVTWNVEETEITDVYSVTVSLTFEADRLQLLPLDVVASCDGGEVSGVIQVRNGSAYTAHNVQVWSQIPGVSLQISNQGADIAAGQVASFPFTAQVGEWTRGEGWIAAAADDVDGNWAPAQVSTSCTGDGGWSWGWGGIGGGICIGHYYGMRPSFQSLNDPPFQEPTILRLRLDQRAMLERQAFLAELVLNNSGGEEEIADVQVRITARDAGGISRPTHFTITPTVPTDLPDLLPGGSAAQQWVIVPADLDITEPATYTLIATLSYTAGGVPCQIESFPELIVVHPQPEVHVEYFVPEHVRAGAPVLLGVRAENRGYGTARNLRIESAYPQIVSQQGRPVGFEMLGTLENDTLQAGDMLLDFGDIPPGSTVTGGWLMTFSPYHGRFTELGVRCEHQDYQGMALSTLLYCDGGENVFSDDLQYLNANECPDTSTCDKQGCVGGPINTDSGNYGYATTDLSIPTLGDPLRMERSYNSSNVLSDTGAFSDAVTLSPGWTHRYAMRLEFPDLSSSTFFTFTTGDPQTDRSTDYYRSAIPYRSYVMALLPGGSWIRLANNGNGTFTPYPGSQTILTATQNVGGPVTYTLTSADQTVRIFDAQGRLRVIRDRLGNETTLTYTGDLLARVTGPTELRWVDFEYTYFPPAGGTEGGYRLTLVRDPLDRTVQYGYDAVSGNLVTVTDTRNLAWTYTYTGTNLLYEVFNPAGNLVERTDYTSATLDTGAVGWQATYQEDGAGKTLRLSYGEHETTVVETGSGAEREYVHRYDLFGALVGRVDPAGQVQDSDYNWDFRPESTTDALGRTTLMEWNSCCGQLGSITDALSNTTQMQYDVNNNLIAQTDAAGNTTRYEYQGNLLITTTDALSGTVVNTYDGRGLLIQTVSRGVTTTYGYDQFGQRTAVTDALGIVSTYGYDAAGRLVTTTQYANAPRATQVTINSYDDGDNLVRVTRNYTTAGGQNYLGTYNLVTEYEYNDAGHQIVKTDTLGHVTRSEYDDAGRLVRTIRNYLSGYPQNHRGTYNLVTEYAYDEFGHQTLVTDTLGNMSFAEYDVLGRVERTWRNYTTTTSAQNYFDTYNLVTEYAYDAVGNQILVTDTLGSVTYTEYDALNRVKRTWRNYLLGYPQNHYIPPSQGGTEGGYYNLVTEYEYDQVGNQTLVTDTLGRVTFTEYDKLNRPVTVTTNYVDGVYDPAHPDQDLFRVTTYDAAGRVQQTTDHASRTTYHEYDQLGRQVATIQNYDDGVYDPSQPDRDVRAETIYDGATGRVQARVQVAGTRITTTYSYDAAGRLVTTTNAISGTAVIHYDVLGRRLGTIDAEGHVTRYVYDAAGRMISTTASYSPTVGKNHDDQWNVTTRYAYDPLGRRIVVTDALTHTTIYTYDVAGRLLEQRTGETQQTRYGYDALGRRTVVTDADNVAIYSVYDALGRLVETRDAVQSQGSPGNATRYAYDPLGNRTQVTDPKSRVTRYDYDDLGRLIVVTENYTTTPVYDHQTNVRTRYAYGVSGGLVAITDALTHTTVYTYDLAGRRVAERDPLGHVTRYVYDGHGRRVGEIYPDDTGPITVTTAYNLLGWPTQIVYPAVGNTPAFAVEYSYDTLGHQDAVTDSTGTTSYDYSALYRPLGIDAPTGEAQYRYDAVGQRTHLVYPTGETVTYTHDAAGRLRTVTDWDGGTTVYTYTAAGRLSGIRLPNGVQTAYGYDAAGRLVEIEHRNASGGLLARYTYTLDSVGNRVRVEETIVQPDEEPHGPGDVTITVRDTDGNPDPGLHVYAFDGTTYTGYNGTTDVAGQVTLAQLPEGSYRFRADKNGTQFWSGTANHCAVPVCESAVVTTTIPLTATVRDTDGTPEQGLKVYAFDDASYTGYNKTTDASGEAVFTLPMGDYRFRADKNGTQFWSGESNHCTIPGCLSTTVTTTIPVTVTVRGTDSTPEQGLKVYAFDETTYTGYNETTDANGEAVFTLPMGNYRFRADKAGAGASGSTQFWSGESNHCSIPGCTSIAVTTTIPVVVTVEDSGGDPEAGLSVYAFDGITYTGYNGTTDASGLVTFTLPMGEYRFRADKNGTQFWSGETNHCTVPGCTSTIVTTTIPVVVAVEDTNGDPEAGLHVYAFDDTTYTNFNGTTDVSGLVTLTLPMGDYRFRADKNGTYFWSGETNHCTIPGCTSTVVTTTIPVVVAVEDSGGDPEAGLHVYAFDSVTYTGFNGTTDVAGLVTFTLPMGNYRFRADENGTQFWSGESNHCPVPGCTTAVITTTLGVMVVVQNTDGVAEQGLQVYAFDGITYTGYDGTTNVSGTLTLLLPEGDYRFRADKAGAGASGSTQFWSGETNHCTVPGCANVVVTTTVPLMVTVADADGNPEQGLPVYAFDEMTYTGYNETTDVSGLVTFTLPIGDYRFRADKNGTQFWSGASNHCAVPGCTSAAITTTSPGVMVTVADTDGNPEAGLSVYAFDGTTYTGYNGTTNVSGTLTLLLPQGDYRFRADKNGTQFWSGAVNHCAVPGCESAAVTTTIPLTATVWDTDGTPEQGLKVYAFDGATYTGYNKTTDASGEAVFTLPQGDYRFRADKNGTQFWSGESNHCTIPGCLSTTVTTTVPVTVTVEDDGGNPEAGLSAYAFDGSTYTGYNKTTDGSGEAVFTLRQGEYRFRADKDGEQYWSGPTNHCAVPGCTVVTVTVGSQALLLPGSQRRPAGLAARVPVRSPAPATQAGGVVTVTRVITYTYDPLNRLTAATYSTGESYEYAYDQVGNRTTMTETTALDETTVTTYTYDTANRLRVSGSPGLLVSYTWDDRGNLTNDGTFTYTYNAAGRMVRAESVTATLVYTYNANGLRVVQSVNGTETPFVWDWASDLPEMLGGGSDLYLVGHETLGQSSNDEWTYYLPDALGSIRQEIDTAAAVLDTREWTPFGVEVSTPQPGLGYTGEWYDTYTEILYLRARWFDGQVGRFTTQDPWEGDQEQPQTLHPYVYVHNNAVNFADPTGMWADPVWPDSWEYKLPTLPSSTQIASIKLNRTWIADRDKPACCQPWSPCQCVPREHTGVSYPPNYSDFIGDPEGYMKYWLAWEYKANPCFYRDGANCMGTALELSYLYTGPWPQEDEDLIFGEPQDGTPYHDKYSYGDPLKWLGMVRKTGFAETDETLRGNIGAKIQYIFGIKISLIHAVVAIDNGGKLCFEKQSPGLPDAFYQLKPCDEFDLTDWYSPPID